MQLNLGKPRPLEYVAHASFLASLFADYLNSTGVPGWYCGPTFVENHVLKDFAQSQVRMEPLKTNYDLFRTNHDYVVCLIRLITFLETTP